METWKAIPGYEELYEASDCGRIRTCKGKTTSNARFPNRVWKQRILKTKKETRKGDKYQDERVNLWKDGQNKTWLVSRLVALTWCDGYCKSATVNHIDGNPSNNSASNLEWISLKENIRHGFENGLYTTQKRCAQITEGGTRFDFRSLSQASRFLNRNVGYVNSCLKHGRKAVSAEGREYQIMIL